MKKQMHQVRKFRWLGWYCACGKGSQVFVAWASPQPLTKDSPSLDPAEPLYFEFGHSRRQAERNVFRAIRGLALHRQVIGDAALDRAIRNLSRPWRMTRRGN